MTRLVEFQYPGNFWRAIAELIPYSIYVADTDRQCLIYTNQISCHHKFSQVNGLLPFKEWFGFFAQDEIFVLQKDLERATRLSQNDTIERIYKMRCTDHDWGYYHHTIVPMPITFQLPNQPSGNLIIGVVREVSDAFFQGQDLHHREERYRLLANNSNDLIWTTDCDFNVTYISPAVEDLTGYSFEELIFSREPKIFSLETNRLIKRIFLREFYFEELQNYSVCPLQHYVRVEQPLYCKDGKKLSVEIQLSLLFNDEGQVTGTFGVARDITERKAIDQEMRLAATVFESCREAVFITDPEGIVLRANSAFYEYTDLFEHEVYGKHFSEFWDIPEPESFLEKLHLAQERKYSWRGECNYNGRNGKHPCLLSFSASFDEQGAVSHFVGIFLDISEKKQDELRIERLAYYDALTQVPNRSLFSDRLAKAIQQAERRGLSVAVLFLDLDRFKPVNDSLGHSAGDSLLQGVARRLQYCIREEDTVARMGGDEFAVILAGLEPGSDAEKTVIRTANRIISQFVSPFLIEGREVYTSTSVGIAIYPDDGVLADELLRNADMAMYQAKKSGRNNYQFYEKAMNGQAMERLFIENALRRALVNSEFLFHFQPIYKVSDGSMSGVESLLRWQHPKFGLLEPQQFIDLAEETDLIIPIGEWVFENVCKTIARWQELGIHPGTLSVNVSPSQFKRKNFAEWALHRIAHFRVDPQMIVMEITESALMADVDYSLSVLSELKEAGIRIAVDDFGTGYSSLSYLRKFPIDILKIDREFVRDIVAEPDELPLIHGVISIAKSLRLKVVAEGVETLEQFQFLGRHGCDLVQGHYFSRAIDEHRLMDNMINEMAD